jgi:Kef-type K+ transport system membrane component KefB
MDESAFLKTLGVMVIGATALILLLRRLGLPAIVLCIGAGLAIGPVLGLVSFEEPPAASALEEGAAAGTVPESDLPPEDGTADASPSKPASVAHQIEQISHLGIVLLLFLVGLELSFDRVRDLGRVTLIAGVGQIVLTFVAGCAIVLVLAPLAGLSAAESFLLAAAMVFSSTVVVVRLLEQRGELSSLHGRIAVGVLLLQDLAVILGMTVLHGFDGDGGAASPGIAQALAKMPMAFLGMAVLLGLAVLASKYLLDRPFSWAARSGQTLTVWGIAWCLAFVGLASMLGLSAEIGAFLAGISLAQLPCAHDLARRLQPLMAFFIALFFVSLGAGMDLAEAISVWPAALALGAFVLLVKPAIVAWLVARCGYGERTAILSGISLGQISEFSFILAAMAHETELLGDEGLALIGLVGIASIVVSAATIGRADAVADAMQRRGLLRWLRATPEPERAAAPPASGHVVVAGMNAMGRRIVEALVARGERVLAIDTDPRKLRGLPCRTVQGSLDDEQVIAASSLATARLAISALQIEEVNDLFAYRCRRVGIPCIVHAFDGSLVEELRRQGVEHLVDSKMQGNIRLVTSLAELGIVAP